MNGIINKIFVRAERCLSKNWYNPLATLYLNLRCLPFRQAIRLPIAVYGRPVFLELGGRIHLEDACRRSMVSLNRSHPAGPSQQTGRPELALLGEMVLREGVSIDTGTKIFINTGAKLELGRNVRIADNVIIGCYGSIEIGDVTRVAHRSQIFDTNYHFIANMADRSVPPVIKPVRIGRCCWICNTSTVTGGAVIPDYTIVGSNSLVNRPLDVPPYSIVAGMPAKLRATGLRRVMSDSLTRKIYEYYKNPDAALYHLPENQDESIFEDE